MAAGVLPAGVGLHLHDAATAGAGDEDLVQQLGAHLAAVAPVEGPRQRLQDAPNAVRTMSGTGAAFAAPGVVLT